MQRRLSAVIAIVALLFAQLAVSAFACPMDASAPAAMSMPMDGGPCDGATTPNLCDRHCDYGAANVNHATPDIAPDVLALPLPWRAAPASLPAAFSRPCFAARLRRHSPPPLTLFGVLRI
jgi:hypothetical protein